MASSAVTPTACLIVIGNEILSGRTRDANIQAMGQVLSELGVRFAEARVVPDDAAVIAEAINVCRARYTYVFTSGGIGPTHDDITAASVARAFGLPVVRHPEAEALLRAYYRPEEQNPARMGMADLPEGAELIANPVSQAPGFRLENVHVLAGVPLIFRAMLDGLKAELKGGRPMLSRTLTAALREGEMAAGLAALQNDHPDVEIGSYPFVQDGRLGVSVVLRGIDAQRLDRAAREVAALMRALGGEPTASAGLEAVS